MIGCVGNFERLKDQMSLLEAVEILNRVERVETCGSEGMNFNRVERVETCRGGGKI